MAEFTSKTDAWNGSWYKWTYRLYLAHSRRCTTRTEENVELVKEFALSQENTSGTHITVVKCIGMKWDTLNTSHLHIWPVQIDINIIRRCKFFDSVIKNLRLSRPNVKVHFNENRPYCLKSMPVYVCKMLFNFVKISILCCKIYRGLLFLDHYSITEYTDVLFFHKDY